MFFLEWEKNSAYADDGDYDALNDVQPTLGCDAEG